MRAWISILRRHRVVRASAAAIFLYGFSGAATSPYQSVIGIRELGLSDQAYAMIALAASVANVVLAIGIGLMSDRFHSYRRPLAFVAAFGVIGYGLVWAFPSAWMFAFATVGPLALYHATNSMLFGNVRAHTDRFDPEEARIANALMRMMISLSWVLVPGAVGIALAGRTSMIGSYLIAALVAGGCLATVLFWLEPDRPPAPGPNPAAAPDPEAPPEGGTGTARVAPTTGRPDRPAQVRLPGPPALSDLRLILAPATLLRILGVALISQVLHVNAAVLPLILTGQAMGRAEDIGYVIGMVAALEVVFMFFWTGVLRRVRLTSALLTTAALYLVYLGILALSDAAWQVYAASLIGGFAAAGIISLPISYLLDMIRDRPGLSASLIAVNMFAGGALGAGVFALGSLAAHGAGGGLLASLGGYPLAALISGVLGVLGGALLVAMERRRPG
ncbi:MFS transporter [Pseudogemmobacter sonorensis]|uniref:MFS transporter n=1 Tax=Pseudogemmobacter sonorensis TaxID=2989681 RepID=UPI0036848A5D